METDKDIIDLDQIDSQTQNKKKRRNALSNGKAIPVQGGSPFANIMASSPPTMRTPRMRTWADDSESTSNVFEQKFSKPKKKSNFIQDNSDEVIPMIPDLEEVREQELVQQTADAPAVQVNKLINFQDLDKDLLKQTTFSSLDGIDLSQLTKFCLPESQVKEDDLPWNWDNLISDVTLRLMNDNQSK